MNYLDVDRHMILQRNDELLREVQELRLENRLRAIRRPLRDVHSPITCSAEVCSRYCVGRTHRSDPLLLGKDAK
jgi:hypothetical protein